MAATEEEVEDKPNSPTGSSKSDSSPRVPNEFDAGRFDSRRSRSISVTRTRSNNGYGCDEESEDSAGADPFEVHWEGGDSDPMNPRSQPLARKWLIVLIVSASSMCV